MLEDAGCDYAQGYMIARPMSAQALETFAREMASCPTRVELT
jgi:EAL domain-containing protein (putative c-di-GMP-specific phosphodiesterase class I)